MRLIKDFEMNNVLELIKNSSESSSVYIGCDSQVTSRATDFVSVVVVHFDSKHGAKIFYKKEKEDRKMSLRERLWKEVELASLIALELVDVVGERNFCIHLDLNTDKKHKSSVIVQEAIAYIRALGLDVAVKPDAWVSSHCADHLVKGKMS